MAEYVSCVQIYVFDVHPVMLAEMSSCEFKLNFIEIGFYMPSVLHSEYPLRTCM